MANTPSSDDQDKPGSERLSRLYRGGARVEPPSSLDERILAEARKAVQSDKKGRYSPFGWGAPLALAAVVVLSVTVVLLLSREGIDPLPPEASQEVRSRPESAPAKPAEPKRERRQSEEPAAFPAEQVAKKPPPVPAGEVAEDKAEERLAPATRHRLAEESRPAADMAPQGIVMTTAPGNEVERACDLALRRLARPQDARISRKNNTSFEYEGKTYTGCVRVIETERGKPASDREKVRGFFPAGDSDLAAMGWRVDTQTDTAHGMFYKVTRQNVFCLIEGRWAEGGAEKKQFSTLMIDVKCSQNK